MIFTKLRLTGNGPIDFPVIGATPDSHYQLKDVTGLEPPTRTIFRKKTTREGGIRQGLRAEDRQIVMTVGLQPNWDTGQTPSDLRDELYPLLSPPYGRPVNFKVMNGGTVLATVDGDISTFEATIFDKDPAVQITIDTNSPYLVAPDEMTQTPTKTNGTGEATIGVSNPATAPVGFAMKILLGATNSDDLILQDDAPGGQLLRVEGPWNNGDIFEVDTRQGSKGVWRYPGGTGKTTKINGLSPTSTWIDLAPGDNNLIINRTNFTFSGYGFKHTPRFWGV